MNRILKFKEMRKLVCLPLLMFCFYSFAQQVVVFSKNEKCSVKANQPCKFDNLVNQTFYSEVSKFIIANKPLDSTIYFEIPPMQWGKKIHTNYGEISYKKAFAKGFVFKMSLTGLEANHEYILCLNGRPDLVGNTLLIDTVPGSTGNVEKYYDFDKIKTDSKGACYAEYGVLLKPGKYHVRFYVKDKVDSIIILYHDYFKFEVE